MQERSSDTENVPSLASLVCGSASPVYHPARPETDFPGLVTLVECSPFSFWFFFACSAARV